MKKFFLNVLDSLLFSNVFMAICAVCQALVTYILLDQKADPVVPGLLFCSTLAVYNFSILFCRPEHPERSPFRRVRWFYGHYRLMVTITIVCTLSLIPLALFLSTGSQLLLVFLGSISVLYNLPLFSWADKRFGLRNLPGIKLFLIALVWSLSCVMLPVLELESRHAITISTGNSLLLTAKRFLLIAALAIPFDIRDLFQDKTQDLKTIPVMLGEKKAWMVCQGLLLAYLVMLFLFQPRFDAHFAGLTLTVALAGWLIFKSNARKNEYFYFLFLDGILVMQYVILVVL